MRNATLVEGGKLSPRTKAEVRSQKSEDGGKGELGATESQPAVPGAPLATAEPQLPPGRWGEFLAGNLEERRLQMELIRQICATFASFRPQFDDLIQRNIDTMEMGRQVGEYVVKLEERLSGKKLTIDFWQQMESVFASCSRLYPSREQLLWFAKAARHCEGRAITTIQQVREVQRELQLASGAEGFELEGERRQQQLHAPPVPLLELKALFDVSMIEERWNKFKADPKVFMDGRVREDLLPVLREEFRPGLEKFEEIKRAVGL
jgi:hypothetical protein